MSMKLFCSGLLMAGANRGLARPRFLGAHRLYQSMAWLPRVEASIKSKGGGGS